MSILEVMENLRRCRSSGVLVAGGILQVKGDPEVMQNPGGLQSVEVLGGGFQTWAARGQDSGSDGGLEVSYRDPRRNSGSGVNEGSGGNENL